MKNPTKRILLLGSGELGKEVAISAKRLGCEVIAVDSYSQAPAMQVADHYETIDMLDGKALAKVIKKHKPDFVLPEIEAIRTEKLLQLEKKGVHIVPTAEAAYLTMNREAIRDLAAGELKLRTAKYAYANSLAELESAAETIGFPCVVKPIMSSSGKGQTTLKRAQDAKQTWKQAIDGARGDQKRVIVEEFIPFEQEITLLTVKQRKGPTIFVKPIGHRQEGGDYRESWLPAKTKPAQLKKAQEMAKKITDRLGGTGLFGVEFFLTKNEVIFSELSPRPHDTGMVTMIAQDLSEFDLHVRAILGLPIPTITYYGPSASAVILASKPGKKIAYLGLAKALKQPGTDVRIFGKPTTRKNRRMGVALARAKSAALAVKKAKMAAGKVRLEISR